MLPRAKSLHGVKLKKLAWVVLAIIFGCIGFLQLDSPETDLATLVEMSGEIVEVKCSSGSRDGEPTVALSIDGGVRYFIALEEFSHRTSCDEQIQNLIGLEATVLTDSEEKNFGRAYEMVLEGRRIYSVNESDASVKETGYALIFLALFMLVAQFFGNDEDI